MEKFSVFSKSFVRTAKFLLAFLLSIICTDLVFSQTSSSESGWYLTNYTFKDGSLSKGTVLMGTTSTMKDVISFKGDKGKIEISHNNYDDKTGKLLAGV
ncbi:MAG: hypothetical protein Q8S41_07230, partial [Lutibacter sp.]|nr:hypothetical protein [Lutibacter sp.]